jgi:hypothetical protein
MSYSNENVLVMKAKKYDKTIHVVYHENMSEGMKDKNGKPIIMSIESFFGLDNYDNYNNITVAVKYPIDVVDIRTILKFFRVERVEGVSIELKEMKFSEVVGEQKVEFSKVDKKDKKDKNNIVKLITDELYQLQKSEQNQPSTNLQDEIEQLQLTQQLDETSPDLELKELKEEKSTEPLSGCDLCKSIKNIDDYKDTKTKSVLCDKCGKLADISSGGLFKKLNKQSITDPDNKSIYLLNPVKNGDGNGPLLDNKNIESVLNYLKYHIEKTPTTTKNKYFFILYGPPASGKSYGKKIGHDYIKKYFEPASEIKNIQNSFIDTNVDDIVYDSKYENKKTSDVLKDIYNKIIKSDIIGEPLKENKLNGIDIIKTKIITIINETSTIYQNSRKSNKTDDMSTLLLYLAIYLEKNIYFETASFNLEYMAHLFDIVKIANYIPIIIYPLVTYSGILYNRAIKRGMQEGRFVACDNGTPFSLKAKMITLKNGYQKLKELLKEKHKIYMILQYDSTFPEEIPESLRSKYTNKGIFELEIVTNNEKKYQKDDNYDKNTELHLLCNLEEELK